MKRITFFTNSILGGRDKSLARSLAYLLIFSVSMLPLVHLHPVMQHYENGESHVLKGKVDFLSFADNLVANEPALYSEAAETPEVKYLFDTKRGKKLDSFVTEITAIEHSLLSETVFLLTENPSPAFKKNHYHSHTSLSPPVSLT